MWLGTGGPSMGSDARQSVQLGITKTFLRKEAHDMLEGRRSRRFLAAARTMQVSESTWIIEYILL